MQMPKPILVAGIAAVLLVGTPSGTAVTATAETGPPMQSATAGAAETAARAGLLVRNGRIVFNDFVPPGSVDVGEDVFSVRPDGTGRRRLTFNSRSYSPRWGPFGHRIMYVRGGDIWLMNADGSEKHRVRRTRANEQEPDWGPQARRIVYTAENVISRLMVYRFATATVTPIAGGTGNFLIAREPAWSPDGRTIVFVGMKDDYSNSELFAVRPDGTGLTRLTFTEHAYEGGPSWSPTGERIVFNRTGEFATCAMLLTIRADGTHPYRVRAGCPAVGAVWSPDGRKFVMYRSDPRGVWITSLDGSRRRFVTTGHRPDWRARH